MEDKEHSTHVSSKRLAHKNEIANDDKVRTGKIDAGTKVRVDFVNPKPEIGLVAAVAFGAGCMIGSGIFISPRGALKYSGSIGEAIFYFIATAFLSSHSVMSLI